MTGTAVRAYDRALFRARLTALEEGYPVHVSCGSEVESDGKRRRCCRCGIVSRHDVAEPGDALEHLADDLRLLLAMIEHRTRERALADEAAARAEELEP